MASPNDQDWQLTKNTVLQRNQFMFNNDLISDIIFTCGESSRKYCAHKYVLATSSPVFFAMFYGSLPEKESIICLHDTDDDSFEEFLRFIYTDDCQLTPESVVKVMYLGKKYMVPSLTEKCAEEMKKAVKAETVFAILEQAVHFEENELAEQCWEVVQLETGNVLTLESFNRISQATLVSLLKKEWLTISEVELFQAVIKWSDNQCLKNGLEATGENRRSVIGDAAYQISFLSMTQQEFAQHVGTSEIFSHGEIVPIYAKFNGCDTPALKWKPCIRVARVGKQIRLPRCSAKQVTLGGWHYGGQSETLCFSVDKHVLFHGVRLFGDNKGSEYKVSLEIEGVETSGTYISNRENNSVYGYDIMLPKPLLIEANKTVRMIAIIKGPPSAYMNNVENTSVTVEGVTLTFSNSPWWSNGTNVAKGQFYEIIIFI